MTFREDLILPGWVAGLAEKQQGQVICPRASPGKGWVWVGPRHVLDLRMQFGEKHYFTFPLMLMHPECTEQPRWFPIKLLILRQGKCGDLKEGWVAISVVYVCAETTRINGNPWERLNTKVDPLSILPSAFFWKKYSRESWEKVMSALELALWYYFLKIYCLLMAVFQQKLMSSYVVQELGTFVACL